MAVVTVTIRTEDGTAIDIDAVDVQVFDAAGTTFITGGVTGTTTPGELDVSLLGDVVGVTYTVYLFKAGVSFLPEPKKLIVVTDPPSPPNFFTFVGTIGLVGQLTTFHVQDDAGSPASVPGARVRLFDAGDSFLAEGDTDANGDVTMVLAGAPDPGLLYIIRLFLAGWEFTDGPTQTIQVQDPLVPPALNTFDIEATIDTLAASSDPEMCLVSGFLTDQARRPLANFKLRFLPLLDCPDAVVSGFPFPGEPAIVGRDMLLREAVFESDDNGYVEVLLPRKGIYEVHLHSYEMPGLPGVYRIQVPDSTSAQLEDMLFPWVESIVWSTIAINIAVSDTETLTPTVTGSNDQVVAGSAILQALLDFTVADPAVASFSFDTLGNILITGIVAGVTTLSVARVVGTYAQRSPDISALIITPATVVTITVTP